MGSSSIGNALGTWFGSQLKVNFIDWNHFGLNGTNYCGPGYTDGKFIYMGDDSTYGSLSTNGLDEGCKLHDIEYGEAAGQSNQNEMERQADLQLIEHMAGMSPSEWMGVNNLHAALVVVYFSMKSQPFSYAEFIHLAATWGIANDRIAGIYLGFNNAQKIGTH